MRRIVVYFIFFQSLPCHRFVHRSPFAIVRRVHWCQPLWFVLRWMVGVDVQRFRTFPPSDFACSARSIRTASETVHHRRHRIYCPATESWRALLYRPSAPTTQNRLVYFAIHALKTNRSFHVPISISQLLCPINFRETICCCRKWREKQNKNIVF